MKVLNIGSLNIDRVYGVDHFVAAKETLLADSLEFFPGGKGLNQSIALARAGAQVYHAGAVGADGDALCALLEENGVDIRHLQRLDTPSGHAVIQLNPKGQNCILVHGGANWEVSPASIDQTLSHFDPGDLLLMQNETSSVAHAMRRASELGLRIAFNPSPINESLLRYPLELVDYFLLNEVEGKALAEVASDDFEEILSGLAQRFPRAHIVLTVGRQGVMYRHGSLTLRHGIYDIPVVDTTAAGDTFCGYFLACTVQGMEPAEALEAASIASSLAVGKKGAGSSIPARDEVARVRSEIAAIVVPPADL